MYEGQTITDNDITWKVKNINEVDNSSSPIWGGGPHKKIILL